MIYPHRCSSSPLRSSSSSATPVPILPHLSHLLRLIHSLSCFQTIPICLSRRHSYSPCRPYLRVPLPNRRICTCPPPSRGRLTTLTATVPPPLRPRPRHQSRWPPLPRVCATARFPPKSFRRPRPGLPPQFRLQTLRTRFVLTLTCPAILADSPICRHLVPVPTASLLFLRILHPKAHTHLTTTSRNPPTFHSRHPPRSSTLQALHTLLGP